MRTNPKANNESKYSLNQQPQTTMKLHVFLAAALLCVLSPISFAQEAAPSSPHQKMPWEDPSYAKDIPATKADSRAEERAKGGWTEFIVTTKTARSG
jgi:hypothetical protein